MDVSLTSTLGFMACWLSSVLPAKMLSQTHREMFYLRVCRLNPFLQVARTTQGSHRTSDFARSPACRTWVVERHEGPRTCRTMSAMPDFPMGGPEEEDGVDWLGALHVRWFRWLNPQAQGRKATRDGSQANSPCVSINDKVFDHLVNSLCLECLLLSVSAASTDFMKILQPQWLQ